MHFIDEFNTFTQKLKTDYNVDFDTGELVNGFWNIQSKHIDESIRNINSLNYVQWFTEYKKLLLDLYKLFLKLPNFYNCHSIIQHCISLIRIYIKEFVEDLKFINREEIKVLCFLYSEVEDLKVFVCNEEIELGLYGNENGGVDILSNLNSDLLKLIKTLALNDINVLLKRLYIFNYTSQDTKKIFIIEVSRVLEDYKYCSNFTLIETLIKDKIDNYILNELILVIKFTSEEFLEFRDFYLKLKPIFTNQEWNSDEGCKSLDALFEGNSLNSKIFKVLKEKYTDQ